MKNKKELKVLCFTYSEWLLETAGMTNEEKGAFLDLLILQSYSGRISEDLFLRVSKGLACGISYKFKKDECGNYFHELCYSYINSAKKKVGNNKYGINQYDKSGRKVDGLKIVEVEKANNLEDNECKKNKREVKAMPIPELSVFLDYCKTLIPDSYDIIKQSLELKYIAWKESGWKNGHDKDIKNWKSAIANTIPYLNKVRSVPTSKINNIINETNKLLAQNGITNTDYIPKGWD